MYTTKFIVGGTVQQLRVTDLAETADVSIPHEVLAGKWVQIMLVRNTQNTKFSCSFSAEWV